VGLTTLPPSVSRLSNYVVSLTFHQPIGLHGLLRGIVLLFFFTLNYTQRQRAVVHTDKDVGLVIRNTVHTCE
jgi:hypothetical protein